MASNKDFYITDTDKEWIHDSFAWLVQAYGYPSPDFTPILFTKEYFPASVDFKKPAIEPLLQDLCKLFKIDPSIISFEIEEDIRDTHGIPYQIQGMPFECDLDFISHDKGYRYKLFFAKSILKYPKRLVFNAVFHFIQIRRSLNNIEWIRSEEHYFIFYLIGIYTGWGVILAQTMTDIGRSADVFWEKQWKFISPMPIPVMAYAMALHSSLRQEINPSWKNFLPSDIKVQYEMALDYIGRNPNPVFNKQELSAKALIKQAREQAHQMDFDSAIETYQKATFLTKDEGLLCLIYNNMGYAFQCKGEFEKSIPIFQKALEIDIHASYANENLSFAFIMLGDTVTGKYYHDIAQQRGKSVKAYAYRNVAMYHQKRGEREKARQNFIAAFEHITIPVDWLEYLYARFLFEQDEKEEALVYLQMAVNKNEPQAIQWMNEINASL